MFLNTNKVSCGKFPRRDTAGKLTFFYPFATYRIFGGPELSVHCCKTVLGEDEVFLEKVSCSRTVLGIFFFRISPKISEDCTKTAEGPRKFKWKETKNNAKEAHLLNV